MCHIRQEVVHGFEVACTSHEHDDPEEHVWFVVRIEGNDRQPDFCTGCGARFNQADDSLSPRGSE